MAKHSHSCRNHFCAFRFSRSRDNFFVHHSPWGRKHKCTQHSNLNRNNFFANHSPRGRREHLLHSLVHRPDKASRNKLDRNVNAYVGWTRPSPCESKSTVCSNCLTSASAFAFAPAIFIILHDSDAFLGWTRPSPFSAESIARIIGTISAAAFALDSAISHQLHDIDAF